MSPEEFADGWTRPPARRRSLGRAVPLPAPQPRPRAALRPRRAPAARVVAADRPVGQLGYVAPPPPPPRPAGRGPRPTRPPSRRARAAKRATVTVGLPARRRGRHGHLAARPRSASGRTRRCARPRAQAAAEAERAAARASQGAARPRRPAASARRRPRRRARSASGPPPERAKAAAAKKKAADGEEAGRRAGQGQGGQAGGRPGPAGRGRAAGRRAQGGGPSQGRRRPRQGQEAEPTAKARRRRSAPRTGERRPDRRPRRRRRPRRPRPAKAAAAKARRRPAKRPAATKAAGRGAGRAGPAEAAAPPPAPAPPSAAAERRRRRAGARRPPTPRRARPRPGAPRRRRRVAAAADRRARRPRRATPGRRAHPRPGAVDAAPTPSFRPGLGRGRRAPGSEPCRAEAPGRGTRRTSPPRPTGGRASDRRASAAPVRCAPPEWPRRRRGPDAEALRAAGVRGGARRRRGGQRRAVRRGAPRPRGAQGRRAARRAWRSPIGSRRARPTPRSRCRDAAALVVGARSYLDRRRRDDAPAAARRPGRALRLGRPLRPPQDRAEGGRRRCSRRDGWRARVLADDNAMVDRAAAHRAGIGWWGKNANLLLPGLGSWYVLGCVVTDAPLPADVDAGRGPVRLAAAAASTAAPPARSPRPGVVDARRCLSWLLQAEGAVPARAPGRARRPDLRLRRVPGGVPAEPAGPERGADRRRASRGPTSSTLLDADDEVVLARAERWYIPKRDVRYVRRNALVVLGNVGDGDDPVVVDLLARYLAPRRPAAARPRRLGGPAARTRGSAPADRAGDRSRRSSPSGAAAL